MFSPASSARQFVAVTISETDPDSRHRYLIRPNRSIDSREATLLVASVAVFSMVIAGGLSILFGAWPILPFAGLEVLMLAYVVWRVQRNAGAYEVLELDEKDVLIERHGFSTRDTVSFQRYWCRVELVESRRRNHPSRLYVGSHGKRVRIGECLTDEERESLAERLGACLRLERVRA